MIVDGCFQTNRYPEKEAAFHALLQGPDLQFELLFRQDISGRVFEGCSEELEEEGGGGSGTVLTTVAAEEWSDHRTVETEIEEHRTEQTLPPGANRDGACSKGVWSSTTLYGYILKSEQNFDAN